MIYNYYYLLLIVIFIIFIINFFYHYYPFYRKIINYYKPLNLKIPKSIKNL